MNNRDNTIDDIHQKRHRIVARFGGDMMAILEGARKRQAASGRPVWQAPTSSVPVPLVTVTPTYGNQRPHQMVSYSEVNMSLRELETAVAELPFGDLATFAQWFDEYIADAWDRRIEADIRAGRLDEAGRQADAEFEAGRCKPL